MNEVKKNNDEVPVFKSWRAWYWLVILFLVALAVLFYFFTKKYE